MYQDYECFVNSGTLIYKQNDNALFMKQKALPKLTPITGFKSTVLLGR